MLRAVIFDFDGVIVDTEPLHYQAFQRVLREELCYPWEEYVEHYIGFDDRDALTEAYKRGGQKLQPDELPALIERKAEAFQELIKAENPVPYPGVLELLQDISGAAPLALCSGALRQDIDPILDYLGLNEMFDVIVTADDVVTSKPDPACYLKTLERLNGCGGKGCIDPGECVAIEDTLTGIKAASRAGMNVLAVANSYDLPGLTIADRVVESLELITLSTLHEWFSV